MAIKMKYPNVNWVNGMKIRKEHFIQQENAFEDRLKDNVGLFLHSNNYGLLPIWQKDESSYDVVIQSNNQKFVQVSITNLRAVTPGGARIEIVNPNKPVSYHLNITNEINSVKTGDSGVFYIMFTVDPFNKEPFGEILPEEDPPRYPSASSGFSVTLFPASEVAANGIQPYSVFIGKLLIKPDSVSVFEDFIPPCMSFRSHKRLIFFHTQTEKFYTQLESNVLSIIKKIREKGQDSSLSDTVLKLSESILQYLNANILKLKWIIPDQQPLFLFENIASIGRVIRNSIDCNTAAQKEEMLNYFTNWSELKQGDFEKLLVYCINFDYHHNEIASSIDEFSEFLQIIDTLFNKLESLAFIGKKKETNIFVKEQSVKRSFLAD